MATRLYTDSATAPSISPAFSAVWDVTADAQRVVMGTSGAIADNNVIGGTAFPETSAVAVDVLALQFTSLDTIPAARTIGTGTFSAVFSIKQSHANADGYMQIVLKVVTSAGALRGVLYAGNAATTVSTTVGATNEEMTITPGATRVYVNVGLSSVACQTGDRIVLELGAHMTNTTASSRSVFIRRGYDTAVADYALTSGLTDLTLRPWIEFSEDIFATTPPPTGDVFSSLGAGSNISHFPTGGLITRATGIEISRANTTHAFVNNGAGDINRLWMVRVATGAVEAELTISGATNVAWEDLAYYAGKIYIADTGNASGIRTDQKIYAFTEPATVADATIAATAYPVTIDAPGTALECSTLMIRPSDGATFLYLKANATNASGGLYQGPNVSALSTTSANHFTRVINLNLHQVTSGGFSSDGRYYVLTTNGTDPTFPTTGGMYVYGSATNTELGRFAGDVSGGGSHPAEAICWGAAGVYVYRTYGGGGLKSDCPIFRYPVNYTTSSGGTLTANAGADITNVGGLANVVLVGAATGGSGVYAYSWTQTGGPTVTLNGTGPTRTFMAPGTLGGTTLTFQLSVTDSVSTNDTDTMTVAVLANRAWMAKDATLKPIRLNVAADQSGGDPLPKIPTISATKFRGYWGTRIFPNQSTGASLPSDHHWITDLHPSYVSHKLLPTLTNDNAWIALVQNLAAEGTLSTFTVGEPFTTYSNAEWDSMMTCLKTDLAGCVLMVNGQNEVNHVRSGGAPPPDWAAQAAAHQTKLWRYMNVGGTIGGVNYGTPVNTVLTGAGHPAIWVGTPSIWSGSIPTHNTDLATLAPLVVNFSDAIQWHLYPRGVDPTWNLDAFFTNYKSKYGANRPIFCGESGYFAAPNYTGTAINITPYAMDIYLQRMWLEYALRGAWVSQFEFANDVDPSGGNRESWLGLVLTDTLAQSGWHASPAYTSLKAMHDAVTGGTDGQVGCIIQTTGNVQHLAVNHSGGNKLYLWRRDNVEANLVKIPLTPVAVTVTSLGGVQTVNVSDKVVVVNL